ncbi:MAG: potassium channel protein [Nitrospirae bacterium]|nr:potassium channel protein [Nitrospirota bacterium]
MNIKFSLLLPFFAIIGVISLGTAGYVIIEEWDLFDSLYMTIITLTTVGYQEVHRLSRAGRFFTIFLILSGVGAMLYALGSGAKIIFEGEIRQILGRSKLDKKIQGMKEHFIVCGYGRMGKIICREMIQNEAPFVVIENAAGAPEATDGGILFVIGDATQDTVLKEAGIERAKGLISVLPSDADNLYVVLSARGLNPGLKIVARAGEEGSDQKLLRAGADHVISPYHIGGLRIAHTLLKPSVVDFIEFATRSGNLELQIEEIKVRKTSNFIGRTLDECGLRKALRVIIVAIKRETGEMEFNPTSTTDIRFGDTLIAMGDRKQLKSLEELMGT